MSDEGVLEKAHSAVKKMVEKYAKAAVEHPGTGADTAQQITLLTETFRKFVNRSYSYIETPLSDHVGVRSCPAYLENDLGINYHLEACISVRYIYMHTAAWSLAKCHFAKDVI